MKRMIIAASINDRIAYYERKVRKNLGGNAEIPRASAEVFGGSPQAGMLILSRGR